jgi:hypothetical protein
VKKLICAFAVLAVSVSVSASPALGDPPTKDKDGNYFQGGEVLSYSVDVVTQQCYVVRSYAGGIQSIPCEILARRPEWKPLLTWVKK